MAAPATYNSATYRLVYHQSHVLDLVSEIRMSREEAVGQLNVEHGLHKLLDWDTRKCPCGMGFTAERGDVHRAVHAVNEITLLVDGLLDWEAREIEESDLETVALAVGILQPASNRNGLEVVA